MKVLCENYENCTEFKNGVLEERCPHTIPHEKDDRCDYPCGLHRSKFERILNDGEICREIILKKEE